MNDLSGIIIEGIDIVDLSHYISKKNKKYQAMILSDLEDILDSRSEEFKLVRKIVLDSFNDYTRSIMRLVFPEE